MAAPWKDALFELSTALDGSPRRGASAVRPSTLEAMRAHLRDLLLG